MDRARALDVVGAFYDAASGDVPWAEVGGRLKAAVEAPTMALWVTAPGRRRTAVEFLCAVDVPAGAEEAYAARYHALDPWSAAFRGATPGLAPGHAPQVSMGEELVPDADLLRSEFYADYARGMGFRHVAGSVVPLGAAGLLSLAVQRPEGARPFRERERQFLTLVLPHLARAAQLRHRLASAEALARTGGEVLDALTLGAVVVDSDRGVVLANAAARAFAEAGAGLRIEASGQVAGCRPCRLMASHRADDAALGVLVRQVALLDGAGGGLALRPREGGPRLALLVAPLPSRLSESRTGVAGRARGLALVLIRDLAAPVVPRPELLADLFGLTRAEAGVAVALAGGATPADVAATRAVSMPTVRSQVRAILEKTGTASLRDLQAMLVALPVGG